MVKCYTRKFTIVFKMGLRKYRKKEREIEPEFRSQLVEREERKRERERGESLTVLLVLTHETEHLGIYQVNAKCFSPLSFFSSLLFSDR